MNFLDQVFLENTIRSYIIVAIVILLAFLIRRILSKYVTAFVFKMGKTQWRGLSKEKFDDIILTPLERIFLVLVIIFAVGTLNFPKILDVHIFKITAKEALNSIAAAFFIIAIISLLLRFMDFIILNIKNKSTGNARSEHQLLFFFRDFIRVILIIFGIAFILKYSFSVDIGNLLTQAFADLCGVLVEVERDPAHTFALERQHPCIQRRSIGQCAFDRAACTVKIATINARNHRLHDRAIGIIRAHRHGIHVHRARRHACGGAARHQQGHRQDMPTRTTRRNSRNDNMANDIPHQTRPPTTREVMLV